MPNTTLLPTNKASAATGLSIRTLHRWINAGIVEEGVHFHRGLHPKSPHRWDVAAVEQRIQKLRKLPSREGLVA